VLSVEDWAEIRRLRRTEQMPIAEIARLMLDMHLHGPAPGHHRFTVASMVSRRAGRRFSDLACGTGVPRIRHGTRIRHDNRRHTVAFVALSASNRQETRLRLP
jgi:hypothetical protein